MFENFSTLLDECRKIPTWGHFECSAIFVTNNLTRHGRGRGKRRLTWPRCAECAIQIIKSIKIESASLAISLAEYQKIF